MCLTGVIAYPCKVCHANRKFMCTCMRTFIYACGTYLFSSASARSFVRVLVRACLCVYMRACVRACVCVCARVLMRCIPCIIQRRFASRVLKGQA